MMQNMHYTGDPNAMAHMMKCRAVFVIIVLSGMLIMVASILTTLFLTDDVPYIFVAVLLFVIVILSAVLIKICVVLHALIQGRPIPMSFFGQQNVAAHPIVINAGPFVPNDPRRQMYHGPVNQVPPFNGPSLNANNTTNINAGPYFGGYNRQPSPGVNTSSGPYAPCPTQDSNFRPSYGAGVPPGVNPGGTGLTNQFAGPNHAMGDSPGLNSQHYFNTTPSAPPPPPTTACDVDPPSYDEAVKKI